MTAQKYVQGVLCDKAHTMDSFLTLARLNLVVWHGQDDEVVVSSSHKNGHWGRGMANGLIVSLQSDGPGSYRYDMVNDISNTFAGGTENSLRKYAYSIFRLRWISCTCGQTLVH